MNYNFLHKPLQIFGCFGIIFGQYLSLECPCLTMTQWTVLYEMALFQVTSGLESWPTSSSWSGCSSWISSSSSWSSCSSSCLKCAWLTPATQPEWPAPRPTPAVKSCWRLTAQLSTWSTSPAAPPNSFWISSKERSGIRFSCLGCPEMKHLFKVVLIAGMDGKDGDVLWLLFRQRNGRHWRLAVQYALSLHCHLCICIPVQSDSDGP